MQCDVGYVDLHDMRMNIFRSTPTSPSILNTQATQKD